MIKTLLTFTLLFSGAVFAESCEFYYDTPGFSTVDTNNKWQDYTQTAARAFTEENATGYVMANTWFWDPDEPGVGMNISIQRSQVSASGFYVHGAFYSYADDGTQAWYTVQGDYTPNSNVNDWREDKELFGKSWISYSLIPSFVSRYQYTHGGSWNCFWGNEDSWMGEVNSQLAVTSNGPVLGAGSGQSYPDFQVVGDKNIRMRFTTPNDVEIYFDGETTPSHVMERFKWHSNMAASEADYITEGTWHFNSVDHTYIPKGIWGETHLGDVLPVTGSVNTRFEKFNPEPYLTTPEAGEWAFVDFIDNVDIGLLW